jgi:hypothetical protein
MPLRSRSSRARPLPAGSLPLPPVSSPPLAPVRRPLVVWLTGVVAIVGLTTACTRPADPPGPTSATSTVPTGSAGSNSTASATTPTPTTSPPISSAPDDDQLAIQAVERYYAAFNAALKSLKTDQMRKEFFPDCLICEQDADRIDTMRSEGRTISGGETALTDLRITSREGKHLVVHARATTAPMVIRDSSGKVVTDQKAISGKKDFTVFRNGSTLILDGIL